MKISIITACFNREETVGEAIESVLGQDYPDIEYIVVDGKSRDGSMEVIGRYKDSIAKVISEPDSGMYEAINKGIRAATGEVVGLMHSDDVFFDRQVVSDIARRFEATGAELVYGDGLFIDKRSGKIVRDWIGGRYSRWKVRTGWLPLHPTVYIRRGTMERWGLYDESYKIAADSDLLVRYLYEANLKVEYLNRYVVRMRTGGLSTDSSRRKLMWEEDVRMYKAHGFSGIPEKLMKMGWKIPQLIRARKKELWKTR